MAKKNSAGGGIVLIGLIVIAMAVKYWYLLVTAGLVALIIWGVSKLTKGTSTPERSTKPLVIKGITVCSSDEDSPKQSSRCAHCDTESLHSIKRVTDTTIDLQCSDRGKNFFTFKSEDTGGTASSQPSPTPINSTSQPTHNDAAVLSERAHQPISVSSDSVWVPEGSTIQHCGYSIPGGLIYFGSGLRSISCWSEEPALIDFKLPVSTDNPDREGLNLSYWPSYSQIHPSSRAAFLEWLSNGRKDPRVNIGYVFIYFYGLERRALADARDSDTARREIPAIIAEVKRLLLIYGDNGSFRGYAAKFLDTLQVPHSTAPLYQSLPRLDFCSYEFPLVLKVALGQMATDGVPLSAEWALAWAENDPSMPRRMPVQRCPDEFRELFRQRYNEKYAEGIKLKPNKARIKAAYRPASASFGGSVEIPIVDLPDLTQITGPSTRIGDLVTACTDELEGYSRYLGRNPDGKNSIEASSYLPPSLLKNHAGEDFRKLVTWLEVELSSDVIATIPFSKILRHAPSINRNGFGKKEATAIANLLGKVNIGIEPDPRFGSFVPKPEQDVVLFRVGDNAPYSPSAEYSAATIVMHLASAVAGADGSVDSEEERHLEEHLETWLHLGSEEKNRLRAHTQWLLSSFPGMSGVKKRIELLKQDQRESLGRFLVGVAQADGYIDPTEMRVLTKIYQMLGLDTQSLYSHAHSAAIEPVTVQAADLARPRDYALPSPPPMPVVGISLDMGRIEAKRAETVALTDMLSKIFTDDEPEQPKAPASKPVISDASIAGLDPESFAFMLVLASKLVWARDELEKLASDHDVMLDGTLDSINDASFDHFGGPFCEGEDPIEIDPEIVSRLGTVEPG